MSVFSALLSGLLAYKLCRQLLRQVGAVPDMAVHASHHADQQYEAEAM